MKMKGYSDFSQKVKVNGEVGNLLRANGVSSRLFVVAIIISDDCLKLVLNNLVLGHQLEVHCVSRRDNSVSRCF